MSHINYCRAVTLKNLCTNLNYQNRHISRHNNKPIRPRSYYVVKFSHKVKCNAAHKKALLMQKIFNFCQIISTIILVANFYFANVLL